MGARGYDVNWLLQNEGNWGCGNSGVVACWPAVEDGWWFFASGCVEIFWRWVHCQRGVGRVASYGRYLTAREPPWKRYGLPPIVNIIQIVHGFFIWPQGLTSGFNFYSHFSHLFLLCLPLHTHLVFVWFFLPILLLSSNFTTF